MPAPAIPPDANISFGPVTRGSLKRQREDGSEPLPTQRPWRKRKSGSRCVKTELSPEDLLRKDWLQQQPCTIVDCTRVQCHRCLGSIKLDGRKPYDTYHWTKHYDVCRTWREEKLTQKRQKNIRGMKTASQASTPADDESGPSTLTELSERSDSRSPSPWIAPSAPLTAFAPGPLRSHIYSRPYMSQAYPGLNVLDLNVALTDIPQWSYAELKVPQSLADVEHKFPLSHARWEDYDSDEEDAVDEEENRPPTAPC